MRRAHGAGVRSPRPALVGFNLTCVFRGTPREPCTRCSQREPNSVVVSYEFVAARKSKTQQAAPIAKAPDSSSTPTNIEYSLRHNVDFRTVVLTKLDPSSVSLKEIGGLALASIPTLLMAVRLAREGNGNFANLPTEQRNAIHGRYRAGLHLAMHCIEGLGVRLESTKLFHEPMLVEMQLRRLLRDLLHADMLMSGPIIGEGANNSPPDEGHFQAADVVAGIGRDIAAVPKELDPPPELDSKRLRPRTTSSSRVPPTDAEGEVIDVLLDLARGKGMVGKILITAIEDRFQRSLTQSQLTTRTIKHLRQKKWDIPNTPGAGYHLSDEDREFATARRHEQSPKSSGAPQAPA